AETFDWGPTIDGAAAKGLDLLHGLVPPNVSNTVGYRAGEATLQTGVDVAGTLFFHRQSVLETQVRYALDPSLSTPNALGRFFTIQQRLPLNASDVSRLQASADADEGASFAASLWTTRSTYHDALGVLANRAVEAVHTGGWSALALSPDTLFSAIDVFR